MPSSSSNLPLTLPVWLQDPGNNTPGLLGLSVFSRVLRKMLYVLRLFSNTIPCVRSLGQLFSLGTLLLACSLGLLADTPALLRTVPAGGCYCHCAESRLRGGCVKMCDSKRYASRWRASKCAKPHMRTPDNNSHAGPRFPHPGRAEHAQLR
jgi:hypothetical protein